VKIPFLGHVPFFSKQGVVFSFLAAHLTCDPQKGIPLHPPQFFIELSFVPMYSFKISVPPVADNPPPRMIFTIWPQRFPFRPVILFSLPRNLAKSLFLSAKLFWLLSRISPLLREISLFSSVGRSSRHEILFPARDFFLSHASAETTPPSFRPDTSPSDEMPRFSCFAGKSSEFPRETSLVGSPPLSVLVKLVSARFLQRGALSPSAFLPSQVCGGPRRFPSRHFFLVILITPVVFPFPRTVSSR